MAEKFCKIALVVAARTDLTGNDKVILGMIRDHLGENGDCWPGVATLAKECGVDKTTALAGIRRLEAAGDIVVKRGQLGQGNHYSLGSGGKIQPVVKSNRLENPTRSGGKIQPLVVVNSNPNQTQTKINQTKKAHAPKIVFPETLKTPEFKLAWADWEQHRKEIKHKLTPTSVSRQLNTLARAGPQTAIAMIEQSIEHGWRGLFALKDQPADKPDIAAMVARSVQRLQGDQP